MKNKVLFKIATVFLLMTAITTAFATPLVHTTADSHFYCRNEINPNKDVIILVHGWSAIKTFDTPLIETIEYYEQDWQNFIAHFQSENICLQTWNVRTGIPSTETNPLSHVLVKLNSDYKIPYARINIIAHSQGGNYAKDALVKLYLQQSTERVREIDLVTIGTPHTGSETLYVRNVLKSAEIVGYTAAGIFYGIWLQSLYESYENAQTEAEKNKYQIMLGISGIVGLIGAAFIGNRISQFDEIYNYPGLQQLLPLIDNPVLTKINQQIQDHKLDESISAIYSDYGFFQGDEVVPKDSGSWKGLKLKGRRLLSGKTHLGLINGDAEIFACVNEMIR